MFLQSYALGNFQINKLIIVHTSHYQTFCKLHYPGRVWQKRDQKHRPSCPMNKSDSAIFSLSFPGPIVATWLRLQWTQFITFLSVLNKCANSHPFPCFPLISQTLLCKWRDRPVQRHNWDSCNYMRKIKQTNRKSVVAHIAKDRFRALGMRPVLTFRDSLPPTSPLHH